MKKILLVPLLALGFFLIQPFTNSCAAQAAGNPNPPGQIQTTLPMQTVVKVLKIAKDYFNVPLGTLVSGYCSGSCKVDKVGITSSGDGLYRVEYGGGGQTIVTIENDF